MPQTFIAYVATAVVFFAVDYVWLSQVATRFYVDRIGHLMMDKPNLVAAGLFYVFYVAGIVIFAVAPALRAESVATAVIYGALFGFFTYATYDVTNFATLKNWPIMVVVVDVAWGTFLSALSACFGYTLTRLVA
ncbi:DUF2177 family protein [Roseibium sediminicola]|uniref:DUF2177 family protein n=1 Tax=Roseibium sediminicola TaxID=2933272 RepID=A0ABT0H270_9HYPH|nr:DUF2177 family protein [Roseibium sp. CAU 1639]MCK7615787.1 DUF2177 family protein [Roseibium sp. CAU 1639]